MRQRRSPPSAHVHLRLWAQRDNPASNAISRRAEYRADAYATEHGHGETLISGLKKLASHGLSNLTPHPLVVWFSYSHPTLAQRIRAIHTQH